jgi:hypothetical protein
MTERNHLAAVRIIAKLQGVRADGARIEVDAAASALSEASDRRAERDAEREEALAHWHDALAGRSPDPRAITLVGKWVVERENALAGARLDEVMAIRHRDAMALACAERMALRDVAVELRDRLHRRSDRAREERAAQTAGDLHLMKRRSA